MKKAFTMLELVFVIVVIGILAAAIIPSTRTNSLQEAAIQLVSHIRYTQHLAMVDDKYDRTNNTWFNERWQIRFYRGGNSDGEWAYTIFQDFDGAGHPSGPEVAKNPINNNSLLSGGSVGSVLLDITGNSFQGMKKLNLGLSYGVDTVVFSSSCSVNNSTRITFDHLGRPMKGSIHNNSSSYDVDNLIQSTCTITLNSSSEDPVSVEIEPETGYAHIVQL